VACLIFVVLTPATRLVRRVVVFVPTTVVVTVREAAGVVAFERTLGPETCSELSCCDNSCP
jgi:hypothetical protein